MPNPTFTKEEVKAISRAFAKSKCGFPKSLREKLADSSGQSTENMTEEYEEMYKEFHGKPSYEEGEANGPMPLAF